MFMKHRFFRFFLALLVLQCYAASATEADCVRYDGEGNRRTAVFEVEGPWMLDWSLHSDVPLLAVFEMRLHEGASGDYIGTLIELHGTGNGLKLFEEGGDFQIAIVARNVAWELKISQVSAEQAA